MYKRQPKAVRIRRSISTGVVVAAESAVVLTRFPLIQLWLKEHHGQRPVSYTHLTLPTTRSGGGVGGGGGVYMGGGGGGGGGG
ncbi:hypothetical protein, partial [Vibrio fluvialis]|uniref:hypothetical protein n=1 Tax=Vibrio fluvialis TaxID=676 RepID=UPI003D7C59B7